MFVVCICHIPAGNLLGNEALPTAELSLWEIVVVSFCGRTVPFLGSVLVKCRWPIKCEEK